MIDAKKNKKWVLQLLFLLLSILFVAPILIHGYIFGDDIQFHIDRIYEISCNIKHFNLFPQLYSYSFGRIGYLLNSFYPWLTLLPFSILLNIFHSQLISFCLGMSLYIFVGLNTTFLVAKKISKEKIQALFTTIIYIFSGYLSVNLYCRFALGEFLGMIFSPLAFYGLYAILYGNKKDWPYLAWGMSLILMSHLLTGFILSLVFCIIIIATIFKIKEKKRSLIALGKSFLVCLASSMIFLIPFLTQELGLKFEQPDPTPLQSTVGDLFNSIVISLGNKPELQDMQNVECGVIIVLTLLLGVFFWKYFNKLERISYVCAIFIYVCCNCAGLWSFLNKTPLTLIQFPNRLLSLVTFFASIAGGKILFLLVNRFGKKFIKWTSVLGIVLVLFPWVNQVSKQLDFEKTPAAAQAMDGQPMLTYKNTLFTDYFGFHFDNYTPADAMRSLSFITCHQMKIDGETVQIPEDEVISKPNGMEYRVNLKKGTKVELPIIYYLNLHAFQANKKLKLSKGSNGDVSVVTKETNKPIYIEFIPSFLDCVGIIISISTWLIALMVWMKNIDICTKFRNFVKSIKRFYSSCIKWLAK